MSDLIPDSTYTWTFFADTGDSYTGTLYHDTGVYFPGQVLDVPFGWYYINSRAVDHGLDLG